MNTIGVVIEKGPNAQSNSSVPNKPANRNLLKSIYNALGKPVPCNDDGASVPHKESSDAQGDD